MKRPEFVARQSACPTGPLGRLIAWIMRRETVALNDAAQAALAIEPRNRVLEIGFGPARTLERIVSSQPDVRVVGIDVSDEMVNAARQRLRRFGARIELRRASSHAIPYPDASFDRILAVHTLYFWNDPDRHFREIRRVLKSSGLFALGFTPATDAKAIDSFPQSVYRFYAPDDVVRRLNMAGYASAQVTNVGTKVLVTARRNGAAGQISSG